MDHSFDPLIHATVRATVGAIRQTQTTNSVDKLNIDIKTGKGIVPVKNSLSQYIFSETKRRPVLLPVILEI